MVLEQDSLLSIGNDEQPTILQLPLDFVDHAAESITASVSVRTRSVHSEDNQTLSLRDVDPIAEDGVWAIIDDGCNCCCHDELWRQNAEGTMKVLGLHPILLHGKATTFNGTGTSTANRKPKIPTGVTLNAEFLFWSRVPLFDDLLSLFQSMQTCFPHVSPFQVEGLGWQWMSRTPRPSPPLQTPMLELLCHAHIGVFMEAPYQTPDTTKNELVFLLSQACQARLGMTKRVRKRSITIDDSQLSEVARQAGIRLFAIRIDHIVHDDHVCNFLLDDLVTDSGAKPDVKNVARGPDQPCSHDCSTHAIVGDSRRIFPRSVLQADTIIVSCGLAKFERTSWSTQ